jgi:hypothetical protein
MLRTRLAAAKIPFLFRPRCVFSVLVWHSFVFPISGQDTITEEDLKFREYLSVQGWDIGQLGDKQYQYQGGSAVDTYGEDMK